MVGNNLQQLEVGEEKSRMREEKLQNQIMELQVTYLLLTFSFPLSYSLLNLHKYLN